MSLLIPFPLPAVVQGSRLPSSYQECTSAGAASHGCRGGTKPLFGSSAAGVRGTSFQNAVRLKR
ncbi:MAG TPA: hypothetical protein PKW51_07905 [Methanoregulaceae archaeon]|nr:hypothetical protein [Methanoregulaceae archaeon]